MEGPLSLSTETPNLGRRRSLPTKEKGEIGRKILISLIPHVILVPTYPKAGGDTRTQQKFAGPKPPSAYTKAFMAPSIFLLITPTSACSFATSLAFPFPPPCSWVRRSPRRSNIIQAALISRPAGVIPPSCSTRSRTSSSMYERRVSLYFFSSACRLRLSIAPPVRG